MTQPAQQTPMLQHPDVQQPATAQSQYAPPVANFNLLPSNNRQSENSPHYFGSFKINGIWYNVSTWIVFSRNGTQMLSNAVNEMTVEQAAKAEAREQQYAARRAGQQQVPAAQAQTPVQQGQQASPVPAGQVDEHGLPPLPEGYDPSQLPVTDPRHPEFTPF